MAMMKTKFCTCLSVTLGVRERSKPKGKQLPPRTKRKFQTKWKALHVYCEKIEAIYNTFLKFTQIVIPNDKYVLFPFFFLFFLFYEGTQFYIHVDIEVILHIYQFDFYKKKMPLSKRQTLKQWAFCIYFLFICL